MPLVVVQHSTPTAPCQSSLWRRGARRTSRRLLQQSHIKYLPAYTCGHVCKNTMYRSFYIHADTHLLHILVYRICNRMFRLVELEVKG